MRALTGPYWAYSNCSVFASSDAGMTWTERNMSGWGLLCGGNENGRGMGDRMAVHPTSPATIAVGGSDGRVYVTNTAFEAGLPGRVVLPAPAAAAACRPTSTNHSCIVRSVAWATGADGKVVLVASVPAVGKATFSSFWTISHVFLSSTPPHTAPVWGEPEVTGTHLRLSDGVSVPPR